MGLLCVLNSSVLVSAHSQSSNFDFMFMRGAKILEMMADGIYMCVCGKPNKSAEH